MNSIPVITIDGPSGSGKGTVSRFLAGRLGWHFLDSGALYRLTAYGAVKQGISLDDIDGLAAYAEQLPVVFECSEDGQEPVILLGNEAVGDVIRTEQAGNAASKVAAINEVRVALLARQRAFRQAPGLVADGRDMGTAVFTDASLKIFLTASAEERAQRRHKQLKEKGISANLADLVTEIAERDERDSGRQSSPLKPAEDAVIVDTSEMDVSQVLDYLVQLCDQKIGLTL